MRDRKEIKTTAAQIVNYWKEYASEHIIGVEWEDALEYCWRCASKRRLQQCHIIPDSLGGKDELSKEEIKKYIENAMQHSSIHFGQRYPNAATMAGTLRIIEKTVAKDFGVPFPVPKA